MKPDSLTVIGYLILALPLLLFLPGFVLSRTFLKIPLDAPVTEVFFCRLLLSFLVSSLAAMGLIYFSLFAAQNLAFAVVAICFLIFLMKRFRFMRTFKSFNPTLQDFLFVLILLVGLGLTVWPSEEVGSVFSLGAYWARGGSLRAILETEGWSFLLDGPLTSFWFAIVQVFFGLNFSLLTMPIISVISILTMFFWVKRLIGLWGGVSAALFLCLNFASLWFYRLPEGYALAQLLILVVFYLSELFFSERNWGFLIAAFLSIFLSLLVRWEIVFFLPFFMVSCCVAALFKEPSTKLLGPLSRFLFLLPLLWCFLIFKAPAHVLWALPSQFWLMAACGAFFFLWRQAQRKDVIFLIPCLVYPIFWVGRDSEYSFYMLNLAVLIPVVMPSVGLFVGCLIGSLAEKGRIARIGIIFVLGVMSVTPVFFCRQLIFGREYQGLLKFYEDVKRSFLPNDLVFSNDYDLAMLLERLYGLKVYLVGRDSGSRDIDFEREIRRWLKDGGRAYFITKEEQGSKMEGFKLHLDNVMRLRTRALEKSPYPPQERILQEIFVRIYEAVPNS